MARTKRKPRKAARPPAALAAKAVPDEPRAHVYWMPVSEAGQRVTSESVLKIPAAVACVRFIARTLASLDFNAYAAGPDGSRTHAPDHPADWLLDWQANPEMTAFDWRQLMVQRALTHKFGFSEIEFDLARRPVNLWPIHPDRVEVDVTPSGLWYVVQNSGRPDAAYRPRDVFVLKGLSPDGYQGYSLPKQLSDSLALTMDAGQFAAKAFGQPVPAVMLETEQAMSKDAADRAAASFQQAYGGKNSRRRVMIAEQGLKAKILDAAPEQSQMVQSRQFQVEECARVFGVPLSKIAHLLHGGQKSNFEQEALQAVQDCLMPWAKALESEADVKLFGRTNRGRYVTRHDFRVLLRGDSQSLKEFVMTMVGYGVYSVNEARSDLDRNPIGPEGDKRYFPQNMTTLDKVGRDPNPKGPSSGEAPGVGSDNRPKLSPASGAALYAAHLPLFAEAVGRCQSRARQRGADALKRLAGDRPKFLAWLDGFLADQDAYAARALLPPARALAALAGAADPGAALAPFLARYRADLRAALSAAFAAGVAPDLNGEAEAAARAARLCLPAPTPED